MNQIEDKAKKYKVIIFIQLAIIIALITTMIISSVRTTRIIAELEYSKTEKDAVTNELEDLLKEYEDIQTSNDTLNAKLTAEKQRIEELLEELKNVKASNYYVVAQYKAEIETLRAIMRSYIVQIDSLNTKNILLTEENTKIKDEYKTVVGEKQHLINEKKELIGQKDSLENQVSIAAALKAVAINFQALNDRDKATTRISKTKKFQICFNLTENSITKTGDKYVYIRITKPTGEILKNSNSGLFNFGGTDIMYSARKQITYDGKETNVCIYYVNSEELLIGKYTVYIFLDGNQIGDLTLKLD